LDANALDAGTQFQPDAIEKSRTFGLVDGCVGPTGMWWELYDRIDAANVRVILCDVFWHNRSGGSAEGPTSLSANDPAG
jgi:hypothetical protein